MISVASTTLQMQQRDTRSTCFFRVIEWRPIVVSLRCWRWQRTWLWLKTIKEVKSVDKNVPLNLVESSLPHSVFVENKFSFSLNFQLSHDDFATRLNQCQWLVFDLSFLSLFHRLDHRKIIYENHKLKSQLCDLVFCCFFTFSSWSMNASRAEKRSHLVQINHLVQLQCTA